MNAVTVKTPTANGARCLIVATPVKAAKRTARSAEADCTALIADFADTLTLSPYQSAISGERIASPFPFSLSDPTRLHPKSLPEEAPGAAGLAGGRFVSREQ